MIVDRLTKRARRVMDGAREEARRLIRAEVEPEHVLLALVKETRGAGLDALGRTGVDVSRVRDAIRGRAAAGDAFSAHSSSTLPWSGALQTLFARAVEEADSLESWDVGTAHVVVAMAGADEGDLAADVLREAGADPERLRAALRSDVAPAPSRHDALSGLSRDALVVLTRARAEGRRVRERRVGTEHVLATIVAMESELACGALRSVGVSTDDLRSALTALAPPGRSWFPGVVGDPEPARVFSREVLAAAGLAKAAARSAGAAKVGPEHLLVGLAAERRGLAGQVLRALGADPARLAAALANGAAAAIAPSERANATPLSVCVITRDEAENLPRCLEALKLVRPDEIVVLDSGSSDATRDIASVAGAIVFDEPFRGHVGQKNRALELATHDWVLCVDADEAVSAELAREVRRVLASPPADVAGFSVRRRNRYLGRWLAHGGLYPDRKLRLFRKSRGKWGGVDPHDKVIVDGKIEPLDGDLLHRSYRDLAHHARTIDSFTTVMARERTRRGRPFNLFRLVFEPPIRFLRMYVLQLGFLDGMAGFIAAWNAAYYVFLRHAKQYESERSPDASDTPETEGDEG